jgi:hypothetical protein
LFKPGARKGETAIKITALSLFALLVALAAVSLFQAAACAVYARHIPEVTAFPAVRFFIFGRGDDTVSAHIALCDTEGNTFAEIERSWRGTSLSLEFASASFGGKTVNVPYRIAAAGQTGFAALSRPAGGTALKKYFMKKGKCLFFTPLSADVSRAQKALYAFARFALNISARLDSRFGETKIISLAECESGVYYTVLLDTAGSTFLIRETLIYGIEHK